MLDMLLQFVKGHWLLVGGTLVILILLIYEELGGRLAGIVNISPQHVVSLLNSNEAQIIDLRKKDVFTGGHILGAINFSVPDFETDVEKLNKFKKKILILVNNNIIDSGTVGKFKKAGFSNINVLAGGINRWREEKLPLVKGK